MSCSQPNSAHIHVNTMQLEHVDQSQPVNPVDHFKSTGQSGWPLSDQPGWPVNLTN